MVVNIVDNLEWEISHGSVPSKDLLDRMIHDELYKHPNPAIKPEKLSIEIRSLLNDHFPDWAGIQTFWYKNEQASKSIISQYPEFITDFLNLRKANT